MRHDSNIPDFFKWVFSCHILSLNLENKKIRQKKILLPAKNVFKNYQR